MWKSQLQFNWILIGLFCFNLNAQTDWEKIKSEGKVVESGKFVIKVANQSYTVQDIELLESSFQTYQCLRKDAIFLQIFKKYVQSKVSSVNPENLRFNKSLILLKLMSLASQRDRLSLEFVASQKKTNCKLSPQEFDYLNKLVSLNQLIIERFDLKKGSKKFSLDAAMKFIESVDTQVSHERYR